MMVNGVLIGQQPAMIGALLFLAFCLGVIYAMFVHSLKKRNRLDGYTSLAVVGGVLATIALAAPVVGLLPAAIMLAFFAATGMPMIIGDIWHTTEETQRKSSEIVEIIKSIRGDSDANPS